MPCRTCGSPLAADQRYCLECGTRNGPARLDWKAMVAPAAVVEEVDDVGAGGGLPSPRVAAALVLGVLAFGVVVGNAAGPNAPVADAGGRSNLTIVAQAPAPLAAAPAAPVTPVTTTPEAPPVDDAATPEPSDGATTGDSTSPDDTPSATTTDDGT